MTTDLSPEALEELVEDLAELRHDLGKYIAFETRFVGDDGGTDDLRGALRQDLLQTHRRRGEVETAWALWARLRPMQLAEEPEVAIIDRSLAELADIDLSGPRDSLLRAVSLARGVSEATRALHRRFAVLADC